jgi:hypothetical protein
MGCTSPVKRTQTGGFAEIIDSIPGLQIFGAKPRSPVKKRPLTVVVNVVPFHREKAMKIKCPKCKAGVRIGGQSRFGWFTCSSCNCFFHGLEAEASLGSWILDDPFETGCPKCWRVVPLQMDWQRGGYYGPARCCYCGKKLRGKPTWSWSRRGEESRKVKMAIEADERESLPTASLSCSPLAPTRPATLTEEEIEAARIVADVQAGRLPAPLSPDEDRMTPEEEAEYQELERGFAELDRKKAEKSRRQQAVVAALVSRFKAK